MAQPVDISITSARKHGVLALLLGAFMTCVLSSLSAQAQDIVIGTVNEDPREEIEIFLPIAQYLATELQVLGIENGRVVVAESMEQMADHLKQGTVDIYMDSPYPALTVADIAGAVLFLRRWKKGVSEYRSVIFTHKNSGITTIGQLRGEMIAFEENWSSSSYFLPKHSLLQEKIHLVEKSTFRDPVEPDIVGYVFSGADRNTAFWVLNDKVAAGAMSTAKFAKHLAGRENEVQIIHSTFTIPRQLVLHRKTLDPQIVKEVTRILTGMHGTARGQAVLSVFEQTRKFDAIPDDALDRMVEGITLMQQQTGE